MKSKQALVMRRSEMMSEWMKMGKDQAIIRMIGKVNGMCEMC